MTQSRQLTRRAFVSGTTTGSLVVFARSLRAGDYTFAQYHNQTTDSPLHLRLVEMWTAIRNETGGRVETTIFPENNKISGSDPQALQMLVSGEIQFFTLMGGILGNVVPVAEVQQVPFASRSAAHAHQTMDGPLGAYRREEMTAKGIWGFAVGSFDNSSATFRAKLSGVYATWKNKHGSRCWSLLESASGSRGYKLGGIHETLARSLAFCFRMHPRHSG